MEEELGVPADGIGSLGRLSPLYVFVSNNYVGALGRGDQSASPAFLLNAAEVAEVIELPLANLLDPEQTEVMSQEPKGRRSRFPISHSARGSHLGRDGDDPGRARRSRENSFQTEGTPSVAFRRGEGIPNASSVAWFTANARNGTQVFPDSLLVP